MRGTQYHAASRKIVDKALALENFFEEVYLLKFLRNHNINPYLTVVITVSHDK